MPIIGTLYVLLLHLGPAIAPTDSLLQARLWLEEGSGHTLAFTADQTFQLDYGPTARGGRYLMGRFAVDRDHRELTLSVDYLLGKRRLHPRYRRGRDFYLTYIIRELTSEVLILEDVLTGHRRSFGGQRIEVEDPASRRLPKPTFGPLKFPDGGGRGWSPGQSPPGHPNVPRQ